MRIIYFYQYFTTPNGAWSTRAYDFASRWVKQGHQVTVITSVYDKTDLVPTGLISRQRVNGIDVRLLNIRLSNKHGFLRRVGSFAAYAVLASWFALSSKADVAYVSSGPITVGLPGLVFKYLRLKPLVMEVRDLWPEGAIQLGVLKNPLAIALARFLERRCYRAASAIVALSPGMKAWIMERHKRIPEITVVPNTAQTDLVDRVPALDPLPDWARDKRCVLYTGTLGLIDDCMQLVELADELERRDLHQFVVVLIGDGKERQAIGEQIERRKLDNIRLLGLMPKTDVMSWLKRGFCALLVTKDVEFLNTASPNKLFDGFAVGIPTIQTTGGWIKTLIDESKSGLNVPANDSVAMVEALLTLEDERLHRELSANARRLAETRFHVDWAASTALTVLGRAAGKP